MRPRSAAGRYGPFLAIAALQLILVSLPPSSQVVVTGASRPQSATGASGYAASPGQDVATSTDAGSVAAVSTLSGAPGATDIQSRGGGAAGVSGPGSTPATQQLDALGRPVTGDKSKCAPGGLLQQNITRAATPCMPRFVGDNGGATYPGVTRDEIVLVHWVHKPNPELDQALATQGLAMSPEQLQRAAEALAKFWNLHYELYGRKIKIIEYQQGCDTADPNCPGIEAKTIIAKYHPLAAIWEYGGAGGAPKSFNETLARNGVLATSGGTLGSADSYFQRHAPYVYSHYPSGTFEAKLWAEWYCKKLWGKNATLAGDPTLTVKKRKLAIAVSEDPDIVAAAQYLQDLVSGGMCGTKNDGTTIYTYSTDPARQQEQADALVTRMKNDGMTTMFPGLCPLIPNCSAQGWYPENVVGTPGVIDNDAVGRLLMTDKKQAQDTFGIGWRVNDPPIEDWDGARAIHSVDPNFGDVGIIPQGIFEGFNNLVMLIQRAGPRLTPQTIRQAADEFPQAAGWANPNPWPGWKCCDGDVQEIRFGPGVYFAIHDAREVYWDNSAPSRGDGKPGAWRCPDHPTCRRYDLGQFTPGEPVRAAG